MAFTSKILLRSNSRDTRRAFATLLTGSSAVDVLTSGGYPAGAIVEVFPLPRLAINPKIDSSSHRATSVPQLQAPKREPSWLVAWLAAAAARQHDGVILACGCKEFLRFGKVRFYLRIEHFRCYSVKACNTNVRRILALPVRRASYQSWPCDPICCCGIYPISVLVAVWCWWTL